MKIETFINFTFIFLLGGILSYCLLPPKVSEPIYQQSDICIKAIPDLEEWYYTELIERIIFCESGGNSKAVNKKYGYKAGMGLCQLIPSTVKYCERKLGKRIDPFNREDNLECGMWLLKNEGSQHWGYKRADWGSWKCWSKF